MLDADYINARPNQPGRKSVAHIMESYMRNSSQLHGLFETFLQVQQFLPRPSVTGKCQGYITPSVLPTNEPFETRPTLTRCERGPMAHVDIQIAEERGAGANSQEATDPRDEMLRGFVVTSNVTSK